MDLLHPTIRRSEGDIHRLQKLYAKFGYSKFRMSKFEDYALYQQNKDFLKGGNIITFNGPSGRLLALKQDITLSIVKTASDENAPCKVYYAENVYRASDDANDIREIPQAGVEYIGNIDVFAMSEIIEMAAESLATVSDNYILGISHMGLVRGLLEKSGLSENEKKDMLVCIQNKSTHELREICTNANLDADLSDKICKLSTLFGKFEECFDTLSTLVVDEATANDVEELKEIYALLCETGHGQNLRIDFSVANDMQYYNGITFQGFVDNTPQSVLSGGRYDDLLRKFGRKSGAIGFAVYLDVLEQYAQTDDTQSGDVLVLYNTEDTKGLAGTVAELRKTNKSVCVLTKPKENTSYSKVYYYRNGGLFES